MIKNGNYRWRIVALLFFATSINYIDRQVIGILKPYIESDLNWNEADYGYIVAAFQLAYALGLLSTGKFLDRFGTRLGYLIAMLVWSIAGVFHAAARGVFSFSIARFVLGIGEAANFPAAVKTVAEWFPKKERALATGIFNSGSTIGAIVAPIIVSGITVALGWRWAFIITGSFGFIWIIFWLKYYHTPQCHPNISVNELEHINQDKDVSTNETAISWKSLFKYKQTAAICTTRFISDWVWWFFLFWAPDFLSKMHGVNIKEVVLPLIVIYSVSTIGGIGGGWLSSRFINNSKSIDFARKTTIFICACCVLPIAFVSSVHNLWVAIALLALAAAGHQGWASNIFTIVSDIYPKNSVGSMMGLSGFAGAIGGALSASFVGLILQVTSSYFLIFFIAAIVYLINWLIISLVIRDIAPLKIKQ